MLPLQIAATKKGTDVAAIYGKTVIVSQRKSTKGLPLCDVLCCGTGFYSVESVVSSAKPYYEYEIQVV